MGVLCFNHHSWWKPWWKVTTNTLCSMPHSLCFTNQAFWVLCLISSFSKVVCRFDENGKELFIDAHNLDEVQWMVCLVQMHQQMMLFLCLQCCCLLIGWDLKRRDAICVSFHLSLQHKSSSVSVVFDFNASFSDDSPASPMLLSVDLMRMEECIVDWRHLFVASFVFTSQTYFSECCVWFQCITQWCCTCVSNAIVCLQYLSKEQVDCWRMPFVCYCVFTT